MKSVRNHIALAFSLLTLMSPFACSAMTGDPDVNRLILQLSNADAAEKTVDKEPTISNRNYIDVKPKMSLSVNDEIHYEEQLSAPEAELVEEPLAENFTHVGE